MKERYKIYLEQIAKKNKYLTRQLVPITLMEFASLWEFIEENRTERMTLEEILTYTTLTQR